MATSAVASYRLTSKRSPATFRLRATADQSATVKRLHVAIRLLRVIAVAGLLSTCLRDWPGIALRDEIEALPDFNYLAAADSLRIQGRYAEALLVVETGYADAPAAAQAQLQAEHTQIEAERDDLLRRVREVGYGALTGQGQSMEALSGAVAADLLIVGDVRDLAIQGMRAARGEDPDDVIVALSGAGIALTLAPEVDWSVALLKFARRAGALSDNFAKSLTKLVRRAARIHRSEELAQVGDDVLRLSRSARPAGAISILRHVDDPETLHQAAAFAQQSGGAFTLWLGEDSAINVLKTTDRSAEALLLRAGRKGRPGIDLLARKAALLARPQVLLGLLKSIYKGNVPALLEAWLTDHLDAVTGIVGGWLLFEIASLFFAIRQAARGRHAGLVG